MSTPQIETIKDEIQRLEKQLLRTKMDLAEAKRSFQRCCPHDDLEYHPDPSGNNDSCWTCKKCQAERKRERDFKTLSPRKMYRPDDYSIFVELPDRRFQLECKDGQVRRHSYTFSLLTHLGFIEIRNAQHEREVRALHDEHYDYLSWRSRPDGHGGTKGGTLADYRAMMLRKNQK